MRAQIIVGAGLNKRSERVLNPEVKAKAILRRASELFGGATLVSHQGGWVDNGNYITEPGYTLNIDGVRADQYAAVREFAVDVRDTFEQNCIVYNTVTGIATEFI